MAGVAELLTDHRERVLGRQVLHLVGADVRLPLGDRRCGGRAVLAVGPFGVQVDPSGARDVEGQPVRPEHGVVVAGLAPGGQLPARVAQGVLHGVDEGDGAGRGDQPVPPVDDVLEGRRVLRVDALPERDAEQLDVRVLEAGRDVEGHLFGGAEADREVPGVQLADRAAGRGVGEPYGGRLAVRPAALPDGEHGLVVRGDDLPRPPVRLRRPGLRVERDERSARVGEPGQHHVGLGHDDVRLRHLGAGLGPDDLVSGDVLEFEVRPFGDLEEPLDVRGGGGGAEGVVEVAVVLHRQGEGALRGQQVAQVVGAVAVQGRVGARGHAAVAADDHAVLSVAVVEGAGGHEFRG